MRSERESESISSRTLCCLKLFLNHIEGNLDLKFAHNLGFLRWDLQGGKRRHSKEYTYKPRYHQGKVNQVHAKC